MISSYVYLKIEHAICQCCIEQDSDSSLHDLQVCNGHREWVYLRFLGNSVCVAFKQGYDGLGETCFKKVSPVLVLTYFI